MLHPQAAIELFEYNATLIEKQVAGITHEQSLLQPRNTPNSLNWRLGHLVSARTMPLQHVEEAPIWSDEVRVRYRKGSQPITADGAGVLRLEDILTAFRLSQERLVKGLHRMSFEQMCKKSGYGENTIGQSLAYFQFHETYHVGQISVVGIALGNQAVWL